MRVAFFHHQCSASWSWRALAKLQWVPFKLFWGLGAASGQPMESNVNHAPPELGNRKSSNFLMSLPSETVGRTVSLRNPLEF